MSLVLRTEQRWGRGGGGRGEERYGIWSKKERVILAGRKLAFK